MTGTNKEAEESYKSKEKEVLHLKQDVKSLEDKLKKTSNSVSDLQSQISALSKLSLEDKAQIGSLTEKLTLQKNRHSKEIADLNERLKSEGQDKKKLE